MIKVNTGSENMEPVSSAASYTSRGLKGTVSVELNLWSFLRSSEVHESCYSVYVFLLQRFFYKKQWNSYV